MITDIIHHLVDGYDAFGQGIIHEVKLSVSPTSFVYNMIIDQKS